MLSYSQIWILGKSIVSNWVSKSEFLYTPLDLILNKSAQIYIEFIDSETNISYYYNLLQFTPLSVLMTYNTIYDFLNLANGFINDDTLTTDVNLNTFNLVRYYNLFDANYSAKLALNLNNEAQINQNLILSNNLYPISNTYVDNYCLITINGFIHNYFINNSNKIEVINCGNSFTKVLNSQVGCLDFSNIGSIERLPFNGSNLINPLSPTPILQIPVPTEYNAEINTLFVVLGGYLVQLDQEICYIDENNNLNINLIEMNFVNRYIESSLYLDIEELIYEFTLGELSVNYGNVVMCNQNYSQNGYLIENNLITANLMIEYLNLTPCFFLLVNSPNVQINYYYPESNSYQGKIKTNIDPVYPLVSQTGRIIEYSRRKRENTFEINILDEILKFVTFVGSNSISSNTFYSNWDQPQYNFSQNILTSTASFLKIYSQDN